MDRLGSALTASGSHQSLLPFDSVQRQTVAAPTASAKVAREREDAGIHSNKGAEEPS
jgi:hypothetical protein